MIPKTLIEHAHMFTHAERILAEYVIANPGQISDDKWREVSGLDTDPAKGARMKELAAKGLQEKGLRIDGKGKSARYRFDTGHWETWWRSRPRRERARTIGRAPSVKAAPGMRVHPECRERCQKLCEPPKAEVISIENAKPVSRIEPTPQTQSPPGSPPENAKPVSRNSTQDVVITELGNEIPAQFSAQVQARLRIDSAAIAASHNHKRYEGKIISRMVAELSAKTSTATPKPAQPARESRLSAAARLDRLEAAQKILDNPAGCSPDEIQFARAIVEGSGQ